MRVFYQTRPSRPNTPEGFGDRRRGQIKRLTESEAFLSQAAEHIARVVIAALRDLIEITLPSVFEDVAYSSSHL